MYHFWYHRRHGSHILVWTKTIWPVANGKTVSNAARYEYDTIWHKMTMQDDGSRVGQLSKFDRVKVDFDPSHRFRRAQRHRKHRFQQTHQPWTQVNSWQVICQPLSNLSKQTFCDDPETWRGCGRAWCCSVAVCSLYQGPHKLTPASSACSLPDSETMPETLQRASRKQDKQRKQGKQKGSVYSQTGLPRFRPALCRQVTSTLILGTSAGNSLLL